MIEYEENLKKICDKLDSMGIGVKSGKSWDGLKQLLDEMEFQAEKVEPGKNELIRAFIHADDIIFELSGGEQSIVYCECLLQNLSDYMKYFAPEKGNQDLLRIKSDMDAVHIRMILMHMLRR